MFKWLALGSFPVAVYLLKRYFAGGVCHCQERLDGKTVIITGANSGIGKVASFILAKQGATIILACRNEVEGLRVAKEICNSTGNSSIKFEHLDLTSFENIRSFVSRVTSSGHKVYALVNNAGIFYHPYQVTENGFEITFQTNYLGPFYLTDLLNKNNAFGKDSRVVNVVSEAHRFVKDLNVNTIAILDESRSQLIKYGESKLCLMLSANAVRSYGQGITAFNVNPGNVETNVYRNFPLLSNKFSYALLKPLRWITVKSPKQGAQTVVHAVLDKSYTENLRLAEETGFYLSDCKFVRPSELALNQDLANNVLRMTNILLATHDTKTTPIRSSAAL